MSILSEIAEFMQKAKVDDVKALVSKALEEGNEAQKIIDEGLLVGFNTVGDKWKSGELYMPEVLIAAKRMNVAMEILKPKLKSADIKFEGKAVLGTVQGDQHDIGKNLVKLMFEGKGIEVIDLGTDVSPQDFIDSAIKENADIIACSALLTTTMPAMEEVVDVATEKGVRDTVKIMIGGAPITQSFCDDIGADYYAADAATGSDLALEACQK